MIIPNYTRYICGLDIADRGKDESVLTKRFGNSVHPLVYWQKQDVIEVGNFVYSNLLENGVEDINAIYCDGTGVGAEPRRT